MMDEELVGKFKAGDDSAFETLMKRYVGAIFRFVKHYAGNAEDAEDISQDAFFKVWKNVRRFKAGRPFKPWLFTVARNTALDFLKRRRSVPFSDLDDENGAQFIDSVEDKSPLPSEIFEDTEKADQIGVVLETLHPDHRSVIILHYREELTFEEIADIMNKPMNTVKSWHRRALILIKPLLLHQKE